MELLIDGLPVERDKRGRYAVGSFVEHFHSSAHDDGLAARVIAALGGNTHTDDVEGLVDALARIKRVKNGSRFWKRISFQEEEKEEALEEDYEAPSSPASSEGGEEEQDNVHPPASISHTDVLALSNALVSVADQPVCAAFVRERLMRAVERMCDSLGLGKETSISGQISAWFGVSERAEQLGISLEGHSVSDIGKRAAELYRSIFDKNPRWRWITLASGRECKMNVYHVGETEATLDVALREVCKKRKK